MMQLTAALPGNRDVASASRNTLTPINHPAPAMRTLQTVLSFHRLLLVGLFGLALGCRKDDVREDRLGAAGHATARAGLLVVRARLVERAVVDAVENFTILRIALALRRVTDA